MFYALTRHATVVCYLFVLFVVTTPVEAASKLDTLLITNNSIMSNYTIYADTVIKSVLPVHTVTAKKYQFQSKRYSGLSFQAIQSTLVPQSNLFQVNFNYTTTLSNTPLRYSGIFRPFANTGTAPIMIYTVGGEFGQRNGLFFGWAFGFSNFKPFIDYTSRENQMIASAKTGYNFQLGTHLRIRPSIEFSISQLSLWAENDIENNGQNLSILNQTYPYLKIKKCGCHSYSNSTGVEYSDLATLSKVQLELTYTLHSGIMFNAGVGYYTSLNRSQRISIQSRNASNSYSPDTPGLEVISEHPSGQLFDYSGLSFNIGVTFTFDPTARDQRYRAGGSHYHYHNHYYGGFHGGHSCKHGKRGEHKTNMA